MWSLYNLWRFRIVFAALVALYGVGVALYGLARGWERPMLAFIVIACVSCAALLAPWVRSQRPPRHDEQLPA